MALGLSRNSASSDFSNTSQMGEKKKQPIKSWFWCSSEGNLSPQLAPSTSGTQTPSPEPGVPHSRAHGWLRTTGFGAFQACWFWHQQILSQSSTSSWISPPKLSSRNFQIQLQCGRNSGHFKLHPDYFCFGDSLSTKLLISKFHTLPDLEWEQININISQNTRPAIIPCSPQPVLEGGASLKGWKRNWESPHSPHMSKEEQLIFPGKIFLFNNYQPNYKAFKAPLLCFKAMNVCLELRSIWMQDFSCLLLEGCPWKWHIPV